MVALVYMKGGGQYGIRFLNPGSESFLDVCAWGKYNGINVADIDILWPLDEDSVQICTLRLL
jgi:hypothetical protein